MRALASYTASVVIVCLVAVAQADDGPAARVHFDVAMRHYNLGEYDPAATEFLEAYRNVPDPNFLYNAAQAYRLGGRQDKALLFYKSYLRSRPGADHQAEVERRVIELTAILEQARTVRETPPTEATQPSRAELPPAVTLPSPTEGSKRRSTRWRWVVAGTAAVAFGAGIYLLNIDGNGTCTPHVPGAECPMLYDTKTGGFVLIAVGLAGSITALRWKF